MQLLFDTLPLTSYSWLMFATALLALVLGSSSLVKHTSQVGLWFALLCFAETIYTLGYGMELASKSLAQTEFWLTFEMFGIVFIPSAIILLSYVYRFNKSPPFWSITTLILISSSTLIFLLGDSDTHLVFKTITSTIYKGKSISIIDFGPIYYTHTIYSNIAMVFSTILFYQSWKNAHTELKTQALIILLASFPPWLCYVIYMFGIAPYGLDISAMSFAITGPLYAYNFFRFHLIDVLPIAKKLILDSIDEGIIVLDNQLRIIDSNQAANNFIDVNNEIKDMNNFIQLIRSQIKSNETLKQISIHHKELEIRYQVIRHNKSNDNIGYLAIIHDVTDRNQHLKQLTRQAEIDELTGISNRRMILIQLEHAIQNAWHDTRNNLISLILFDVDHFKSINDKQGHQIGDLLLQQLASLLKQKLDTNENFGRYGGDEFLIIISGLSPDLANERANHLRMMAQNQLGITLSMGLTHYLTNDTPKLMLQRADYALYQSKSAGRNCIHIIQKLSSIEIESIGLR